MASRASSSRRSKRIVSRALIITVVVGLSRSAPAQPCADAPLNLIVQDRYAGLSPTPFDAMIGSGDIDDLSPEANTLDVEVAAGQRGEASVWVGIVSQLGEDDGGIQGFSVTPIVAGGLELIDATFDGTLAGSGWHFTHSTSMRDQRACGDRLTCFLAGGAGGAS